MLLFIIPEFGTGISGIADLVIQLALGEE
jgi:hypothetical protein